MTGEPPCFIGIDIGTSGCRAIAIDGAGRQIASSRAPWPLLRPDDDRRLGDARVWWQTVRETLLPALFERLRGYRPFAIAVDGTSATILLTDTEGHPLTPALMYDQPASPAAVTRVDRVAPATSPANGPTAALPKLLDLLEDWNGDGTPCCLHQADWIVACLTGRVGASDVNNCLKLGVDAVTGDWPDWVLGLVGTACRLPEAHLPGTVVAPMKDSLRAAFGIDDPVGVVAGTTDSIAAFIATGARSTGDAVTSLGSTMVLKIVGERPVDAPRYGVYSHPFDDHWLIGGASNCGAAILAHHFTPDEIEALSRRIDPDTDSGLDYYPLCGTGERFPHADPKRRPRLSPRPDSDRRFLHGLLDGLARVEAEGYSRLQELGAPRPSRILTAGGGAANPCWRAIRQRRLGLPVVEAEHTEAAYGSALLARRPWQANEGNGDRCDS